MADRDRRSDLVASYENAAVIVSGIDARALGHPTPCPDYDVAGMIDHLVEAAHRAAALGRGQAPPPGDESPHVELSDAPARLRRAAEEAAEAWADDSRLSSKFTMPWGEEYTGSTLVDMYLAELAAHSWDLAQATGQLERLDPSLAMPALEGARAMIKPQYRNMVGPGSPFGAEVPPAPGADGWALLAAFTGRVAAPADKEPAPISPTTGQFITETFEYDGGRQVTVYVPSAPAEAIVFTGDGAWHISRLGGALDAAGAPPTMVVGVHGRPDDDGRLAEYVPGFDESRFAAHERFFVEDVPRWVRTRFGVALPAERTAVWGASLGGELALAMGIRHPDTYGAVFSASPGAGYKPPDEMPGSLPRVYLVAGTQEQFFLDNAMRWADALRRAGADVVMTERVGPHGGDFWAEEFPLMVTWAFGP